MTTDSPKASPFGEDGQVVLERAKRIAIARDGDRARLSLDSLVRAVACDPVALERLAACLAVPPGSIMEAFSAPPDYSEAESRALKLTPDFKEVFEKAQQLAGLAPTGRTGKPGLAHILGALSQTMPADRLPEMRSPSKDEVLESIRQWSRESTATDKPIGAANLGAFARRARGLRDALRRSVFGQDHAIAQLAEGVFGSELRSSAGITQAGPAGVFLFAGPPGVGKSYLAKLAAEHLGRPSMKIDMGAYAVPQSPDHLAARITSFVRSHPKPILIFDEIEKASWTIINWFLPVLDDGLVEVPGSKDTCSFREALVIFTTNAGRSLYEDDSGAISEATGDLARSSILSALRSDRDPISGEPSFPAAICSRMATGYPILFRRLSATHLARIVQERLELIAEGILASAGIRCTFGPEIAMSLIRREGAAADARTLSSRAESFLREQLYAALLRYDDSRIEASAATLKAVHFSVDTEARSPLPEAPRPMIVWCGDPELGDQLAKALPEADWHSCASSESLFDYLARTPNPALLLLDLNVPKATSEQPSRTEPSANAPPAMETLAGFDHAALASRAFSAGREILRLAHERLPSLPVYLAATQSDEATRRIDPELLLACEQAGGARGFLSIPATGTFRSRETADNEKLKGFRQQALAILEQVANEAVSRDLARQSKIVDFDCVSKPSPTEPETLNIFLRDFRLSTAPRGDDVGQLVGQHERPTERFDEVIGAALAKEKLADLVEWLRNPAEKTAAGLKAPRGILLSGAPGTGKTMLARALAGESECPFLVSAASSWTTPYQGSGPLAVKQLFERARRYAPSVVLLDEIDAVGTTRSEWGAQHRDDGQIALTELLQQMDGFSRGAPVIVLAATNHPERLDPALLRRFSYHVEVELPTKDERREYLKRRLLAKTEQDVSDGCLDRIIAETHGQSIANLSKILDDASLRASKASGTIDDEILQAAFETMTAGAEKQQAHPERTAWHEAGHVLMHYLVTGQAPASATIVARGEFGGYMFSAIDDVQPEATQEHFEGEISIGLAGRAAEAIQYEGGGRRSAGCWKDLEFAAQVAQNMVCAYGMSDELGPMFVSGDTAHAPETSRLIHSAVRRILEEQEARTINLLERHRGHLKRVADALVERNRLNQEEIAELLQDLALEEVPARSPSVD